MIREITAMEMQGLRSALMQHRRQRMHQRNELTEALLLEQMYYGDGGLGAGGGAMEITPELALYHQMMGVNGSPQFELEDMSYEVWR